MNRSDLSRFWFLNAGSVDPQILELVLQRHPTPKRLTQPRTHYTHHAPPTNPNDARIHLSFHSTYSYRGRSEEREEGAQPLCPDASRVRLQCPCTQSSCFPLSPSHLPPLTWVGCAYYYAPPSRIQLVAQRGTQAPGLREAEAPGSVCAHVCLGVHPRTCE